MRTLLFSLLLVPLLIGTSIQTLAQANGLVLLFPRDGLTDVELRPTVTIRTPAPIIPESITFGFPDAMWHGLVPATPTVLLYAEPFDGPHREQVRRTVTGTYALVDDHTLTFTPRTLSPGTRYRLEISGIDVDARGPTQLPTVTTAFTTVRAIPTVHTSNIDHRPTISCADTVTLNFTGDVRTSIGDLHRILHVESLDSTGEWMPVPFGVLDNGPSVHLLPEGQWPKGCVLRVQARMHAVTGDTLDDRTYSTVVRSGGMLAISVKELDGEIVPDDIREDFERYQQMVTDAPPDLGSIDRREDLWRFVRWESPLLPIAGPDDTSSADVTIDCSLLRDVIPVTAILDHLDSIPITILGSEGGEVHVYDASNTLIAVVEDSLTIGYRPSNAGMRIVAVPSAGYTFSGWSAPNTPFNASSIPSAVVTGSVAGALLGPPQYTTNGPRLTPSFNPRMGLGEVYALKGAIQDLDADVGFNVNESVAFTTEYEFEEATPGTRTICVRCEPCWRIIGYSISASNVIEWIDPAEEYCVSADLTDPENHVVFYAQRTEIQLRVDQVLLQSDDPDDRLIGKELHPEAYVRVDKRVTGNDGKNYWRPLIPVPCRDVDITYNAYGFKCGDVVRFRAKGSTVRGQIWRFFDPRTGYAIPDEAGKQGNEFRYEMVVDEDIASFVATDCGGQPMDHPQVRVRACFRQDFGIEALGMTVRVANGSDRGNARWEERWFDPVNYRPLATDEPRGGRQLEYIPRYGAEIKVRFTTPIDIRTIYDGGMKARSYRNTLITDPLLTDLDFVVASADNEHISFEPTDGSPITTVVFRICDPETTPRLQALHGGEIALSAYSSVTSLAGRPLPATFSFLLSTMELPGFGLQLRDITYECDGDPDFIFANDGEMYHVVYGADLGWDGIHAADVGFARIPDCREQQGVVPGECTLPHSDKDGPQRYGDRLLWMQPHWMDFSDYAWWHVSSFDEDCKDEDDCFVNRAQDLIDMLKEKLDQRSSSGQEDQDSQGAIIDDVLQLGVEFIQALAPPDDQDDQVGEGTFLAGSGNWWGVKTATSPYVVLDQSNARYRLLARLFVQRSVIR